MQSAWRLKPSEIDRYGRDGLLQSPYRLPDDLLARMRASLDRLLDAKADIPPESLICPHIPSGGRHDATAATAWLTYCTNPHILDLVEQLIGRDIILWGSQVFCKPARTGREVPWHQDGQYWPIRPLATCSAWIALDDVDAENGCMRYIPGSHASRSVYRHRVSLSVWVPAGACPRQDRGRERHSNTRSDAPWTGSTKGIRARGAPLRPICYLLRPTFYVRLSLVLRPAAPGTAWQCAAARSRWSRVR